MVEMPSVPKYSMSYHGAGRYDLIFVVSVNRTRITKSWVAKLFNNEGAVSGGREPPITENVQIGTSLVIQWLGLHFPGQGIQVEERRSHIAHSQKTKTLKKPRSNSVTNLVKTFKKINWDPFFWQQLKELMHQVGGWVFWPTQKSLCLRLWFCVSPDTFSEYLVWEWYTYPTSDFLLKLHVYLWCWPNKVNPDSKLKERKKGLCEGDPSIPIQSITTFVMSLELSEGITWSLGSY